MMDNIDLTEKQIKLLVEETKDLSDTTDEIGYRPMYPKRRNGFFYLIIKYLDLTEVQINIFKHIAKISRTRYMISVNHNRLELRFYATFGELPKTLK